jgi:hypothetical protein
MEKIGSQTIWSFFDGAEEATSATNHKIRMGTGHRVNTFFELAKKVAELQFRNREYVLLFRGQDADYLSTKGNGTLKASLFRSSGSTIPSPSVLSNRFATLRQAEDLLVTRYTEERFLGFDRLKRHRILRWAILQHYEVCRTPLLDVTHSLRIAASFASFAARLKNAEDAFLFVLGVPNLSGSVTASSEASLQIIRLSSACPPEAVRPHLQEGYLLGEYPEIADFDQKASYPHYEMDFGRRLVAKFRFNHASFWSSANFLPAPEEALYPRGHRDRLLNLTQELRASLGSSET